MGTLYTKVVEGSFTASKFYDFIETLLLRMQQFPASNSVVVMDNARIHKDPRVLDLITSRYVALIVVSSGIYLYSTRGMRYLFLPPYSPDYNPIELGFSAIKAYVQRERVLVREDLDINADDTYVYSHLVEASYSITSNDARKFFNHCGYNLL